MTGSKSAYARHRGVDPAMVTRWTKAGQIQVTADGKIDFAAADAALAETLDKTRGGKGGGPNRDQQDAAPSTPPASTPNLPESSNSFQFQRARREEAERKLKELELDRQLGRVVEFAPMMKAIEEATSACRKECEGMIQRLPSLVAAESDVRRCRQLIEAELFRALDTLADTCMAMAAKQRGATRQ